MTVIDLIDEARRRVPEGAPFGTRWHGTTRVEHAHARHQAAVDVRIDAKGQRREQYWCDDVRVERSVLLRLTCSESECPHAVEVRAQWQAWHRRAPAPRPRYSWAPQPLTTDVPLKVGRHAIVARPARFPCYTPCPNGAHPPIRIDKTGFDLFEDGVCLGGGLLEIGSMQRPRIPTVQAAEAFVLARHLEGLAMVGRCKGDEPGR
jgi:hypothetical protein